MALHTTLAAEARTTQGKGAARRLRKEGKIPAVVYGGGEPESLSLNHDDMLHNLEHESFYSSIFALDIGGKPQKVVLKDVQRHPARPVILHVDFLRVRDDSDITMMVPVHFENVEKAVGVKAGGVFDAHFTELEIRCLAKDLPESISVDVEHLAVGDAITLRELVLPEGVKLAAFIALSEEEIASHNQPLAMVQSSRASKSDDAEEEVSADSGEDVASDDAE
jgi:large subunit ribosomal protein L25